MASLLKEPLTQEAMDGAMKGIDVGLAFLFDQAKVPTDIQAMIVSLGYSDAGVFAEIGGTAENVREVLKTDVGLDPAAGAQHRAMTARLISVWRSAQKRAEHQQALEAEQRVGDLPRTVPKSHHIEIRRAFALIHAELPKKLTPAAVYVESKVSQLEDGELVAEPLSEVLTLKDVEGADETSLKLKSDGTVVVQKGKVTGSLPTNSEELRLRIRVMGIAWEFLRIRYPMRPVLTGLGNQVWQDYVDWLLSEDVFGLEVALDSEGIRFKPTWNTLLAFELEVRRRAFHLANTQGSTMRDAIVAAMKDQGIMNRYFITPTSLQAGAAAARQTAASSGGSKRPAPGSDPLAQGSAGRIPGTGAPPPPQAPKGKGEKGPGKGSWKHGMSPTDAAGNRKCGRFQRGKCTLGASCPYVHACYVCGEKGHGEYKCPRRPKQGGSASHRVQ